MSRKIIPIIIGILLTLLTMFLYRSSAPVLEEFRLRVDNLIYDATLSFHLQQQPAKSKVPIVIVDIDDKSMDREGRWPWPRNKVATLIKKIQEAGAIVIAMDITFSQPEENRLKLITDKWRARYPQLDVNAFKQLETLAPDFDYDNMLAQRLGIGEVVLGFVFYNDPSLQAVGELPAPLMRLTAPTTLPQVLNYRANLPALQRAAKRGGFVTVWPDADGILRHASLLLSYNNNVYPSLALEAVRRYLLIDNVSIETAKIGALNVVDAIRLGETRIPTSGRGEILIPYVNASHAFPYLKATDVLHDAFKKETLANAIVFVGSSALSLHDLHATPIESVYPGIEVHANIAQALLDGGHFPFKPAWSSGAENALTLVVGFLTALLFPFLGAIGIFAVTLVLLLGMSFSYSWLLFEHHIVLSVIYPMVLALCIAILNFIYGFFSEYRLRAELKEVFGQYLPPSRVELISKDPKKSFLEGDSQILTVLFADIRNFTSISETLTAVEIKNLLNRYFTAMTEIIFKHKGTIDKYVGDMVMAFWGAPVENKEHVKDALKAALDMIATTEELKTEFAKIGLPEVNIGIGLNTGTMYVGDMGSSFRRSYTVLGDNVNLASRLQDLTKIYHVKIVVSAIAGQDEFIFRRLDRVRVKGKKQSVEIFELVGYRKDATDDLFEELKLHDMALEDYYAQRWNSAEEKFNVLIKRYPDRFLYTLYLTRIKTLRQQPLVQNWDGVYDASYAKS